MRREKKKERSAPVGETENVCLRERESVEGRMLVGENERCRGETSRP